MIRKDCGKKLEKSTLLGSGRHGCGIGGLRGLYRPTMRSVAIPCDQLILASLPGRLYNPRLGAASLGRNEKDWDVDRGWKVVGANDWQVHGT